MEMAKYIMSILRTNLMVVFSWGFHYPIAIKNGLRFNFLLKVKQALKIKHLNKQQKIYHSLIVHTVQN